LTTEQLPGDKAAGTPPERWGDFILGQDRDVFTDKIEHSAGRADFAWAHHGSVFEHPLVKHYTSEASARSDARVPVLKWLPPGEQFFGYHVVEDAKGWIQVCTTYLRPELRTVTLRRPGKETSRPALPDEATIVISRSRRYPRPIRITPLRTPADKRSAQVKGPLALLDRTDKIKLKGESAILRTYSARGGRGDTYSVGVPSVALNWLEGDVLWSFQSDFLSVDDAIRAAESISLT